MAHPLAVTLAASLVRPVTTRVLVLGAGNGRNFPPFLAAGARIDALDDDASRIASVQERLGKQTGLRFAHGAYDAPLPFPERYDAALSTSALLHGSRRGVAAAVRNVFEALRPGGTLHLVLGSRSDPRYGEGDDLGDGAFAPLDGPERAVPHVYFDRDGVRALLERFELAELSEGSAERTAGRWAHDPAEAARIVHWFVRARRGA